MACGATLTFKRSLEFEPFHGQPSKRRCLSTAHSSAVGFGSPVKQSQPKPSVFSNAAPKITSEQITARISEEIKRMHHHRRRNAVISASPPPAITERTCSPALTQKKEFPASSSLLTSTALQATAGIGCALTSHCRDTPVLSLRQVGLVCERMIKEREDQLREEYDKVLNDKLNEQYEAFLKFNHDQLHRKFGEAAASYVS